MDNYHDREDLLVQHESTPAAEKAPTPQEQIDEILAQVLGGAFEVTKYRVIMGEIRDDLQLLAGLDGMENRYREQELITLRGKMTEEAHLAIRKSGRARMLASLWRKVQ